MATDQRADQVLANFFTADGRLHTIPSKRSKRLVVLDHLAQRFEPGRVYTEAEVNEALSEAHPDYAALRRYLVDDLFLSREDGRYWRTGGTVDV
jgi:hypothetical protein